MDLEKQLAAGSPDSTREWLLQLERRVDELEQSAERARLARRRSRLFLLVGVALYVLFLSWELTKLV